MLLNDTQIKSLPSRSKPYRKADGQCLFLLIQPNGSKLWQFRYKYFSKSQTLSLGSYPALSLAKARLKRNEAEKLLADNINPLLHQKQEERKAEFQANQTFEVLGREWHQHKSQRWSPRYASNTLRRMELHIFPLIGARPVSEIHAMEVLQVVQILESKNKTDMSHRVLEIMNAIFRRAVITRRVERNPAEQLSKELLSHTATHHPALKEEELPQFLLRLQTDNFRYEENRLATWLLLLTAVRQCELRFSKKSDIDFPKKEWILRPEVTKMKREHIVPLSTQAIGVLESLFEATPESEWLVPSRRTKRHPVMSENTINKIIRRLGFEGRVVGHGFRSMFSTTLNNHGFDSKMVDRQLAHAGRDKIEAAYNRAEYESQRIKMMQWWGDFLDRQLPGHLRLNSENLDMGYSFQISGTFGSTPRSAYTFTQCKEPGPSLAIGAKFHDEYVFG